MLLQEVLLHTLGMKSHAAVHGRIVLRSEERMKRLNWLRFCLPAVMACCLCSLALRPVSGADVPNKEEILAQARQAYYSLRDRGLTEFQASVQPNWQRVLKDLIASNPAGAEAALKMLNGIHFRVSLGPSGAVQVTHREDVTPTEAKAKEGFSQIFSGMEQALSGFFDSWSPFMLTSPFPNAGADYQLEEVEAQYRLSYKDGNAAIATAMSKDLLISEIKVASPTFNSTIRPQFAKSAQGFLLVGYEAEYQGTSDGVSVKLHVQIENQEVSALQLPRKLNLNGSYQDSPFDMELTFSEYQVKRR